MRVLVIPDVHLKDWMFDDADNILAKGMADIAVCLGDIVDDFGCDMNPLMYKTTLDHAASFHAKYPNTLWCKGNHDMAYLWNIPCSGTSRSYSVQDVAIKGLRNLYDLAGNDYAAFVHRIDDVLFSHAGVSRMFVRDHRGDIGYENEKRIVEQINSLHASDMWYDDSSIWLRPQREYASFKINLYKPKKILQVVGHSPVKHITQEGNLISCDTFSTYRDGTPYGDESFCIIDTKTWEWQSTPSSRLGAIRSQEKIARIYKDILKNQGETNYV